MIDEKLCECGCSGIVNPGRRFINGHNRKGKSHTDISKAKMKSRKLTDETKAKMAKSKIGNQYGLGYRHTDEARKKISDAAKEQFSDPIVREKWSKDFVKHHLIYDHSDIKKYTVLMTRSAHATLHIAFRSIGYEIPHINRRSN